MSVIKPKLKKNIQSTPGFCAGIDIFIIYANHID